MAVGADINAKNKDGSTPLNVAQSHGRQATVLLLQQAQVQNDQHLLDIPTSSQDPTPPLQPTFVSARNNSVFYHPSHSENNNNNNNNVSEENLKEGIKSSTINNDNNV